MPHRRTWPRGLRAVFWFCILGFILGVGQTLYWHLETHEFFPELTIQGGYAAIAFFLTATCVVVGALSYRRAFAIAAFVTAAFHLCSTLHFNLEIFNMLLQDMLAGQWEFLYVWDANTWIYYWNWICIVGNATICYYLVHYEFRIFVWPSFLADLRWGNTRVMNDNTINETEWSNPQNWTGPKWLAIYFSKTDSRLWVRKRLPAFGWTLNFGHPRGAVWFGAIVTGIILLVIAANILMTSLVSR